jgi:hypothetical protein
MTSESYRSTAIGSLGLALLLLIGAAMAFHASLNPTPDPTRKVLHEAACLQLASVARIAGRPWPECQVVTASWDAGLVTLFGALLVSGLLTLGFAVRQFQHAAECAAEGDAKPATDAPPTPEEAKRLRALAEDDARLSARGKAK